MTDTQLSIPLPEDNDNNEVRWALETATSLWKSDAREALRWLRRAAESAADQGDDLRSLKLAKVAADLRGAANITGSLPPPASQAPPQAIEQAASAGAQDGGNAPNGSASGSVADSSAADGSNGVSSSPDGALADGSTADSNVSAAVDGAAEESKAESSGADEGVAESRGVSAAKTVAVGSGGTPAGGAGIGVKTDFQATRPEIPAAVIGGSVSVAAVSAAAVSATATPIGLGSTELSQAVADAQAAATPAETPVAHKSTPPPAEPETTNGKSTAVETGVVGAAGSPPATSEEADGSGGGAAPAVAAKPAESVASVASAEPTETAPAVASTATTSKPPASVARSAGGRVASSQSWPPAVDRRDSSTLPTVSATPVAAAAHKNAPSALNQTVNERPSVSPSQVPPLPQAVGVLSLGAVRVAVSQVPAPNGLYQLHPLSAGEAIPEGWSAAVLVAAEPGAKLPGIG